MIRDAEMHKTTILLATFVVVLFAAGCQATIDGSSAQAAQESIEAIAEDVPDEQREQFEQALEAIAADEEGRKILLGDREQIAEAVAQRLDGKTANEVIEYVQREGIELGVEPPLVLDGSSEQAFQHSVEQMAQHHEMSPDSLGMLALEIGYAILEEHGEFEEAAAGDGFAQQVLSAVDGLTFEQLRQKAEEYLGPDAPAGPPVTLDGSSRDAFEESIERMAQQRQEMSPEELHFFVSVIGQFIVVEQQDGDHADEAAVREAVDGMTFDDLEQKAREIEGER